ncbi:MAG: glycogen synthase, partial [Acidobacteria bacterium]|nr:glycogen synthase [Acidobacteriota bacterium]
MDQRIVHFASEAVPFSKTGGLADVLGALPGAEATLGGDVTVVIPAHRATVDDKVPGEAIGVIDALGLRATVWEARHAGARVLLLDCPALFVRPTPYLLAGANYPDNAIRFSFLIRAGLDWLVREGGVDIVHAHDWQAALAPVLLRHDPILADALGNPRTILTIHNLAYQGVFPPWALAACGLDAALFTVEVLEFWGQVSFLKGGILSADAITTVSPTYASEILTPQFGCGLDGVLDRRSDVLTGIVNGLDTAAWNPAGDSHLPLRFDAASAATGKRAAGVTLRHELGLVETGRPMIGMVSRLIEQ